MSSLKRIAVGEPIQQWPANTWNALCDNADAARLTRPPSPVPLPPSASSPRIVNTEAAIDVAFGILFICEPINKPADRASAPYEGLNLCGEHPTTTLIDGGKSWVILQEPAPANRAVPFVATGESWVQIDVQSEADTTAGPVDGDSEKLKSGIGEATIVWKEPGTGTKWAIVRLGGGGGGQARGAVAIIIGTVPASSGISTIPAPGQPMITFGRLEASLGSTVAGAVILNSDGTPVWVDGHAKVLPVINPSYTDFYAPDGIAQTGTIQTSGEEEVFVLSTFDLRSVPQFILGNSPPQPGDPDGGIQIIYHAGGEFGFRQGSQLCNPLSDSAEELLNA